VSWTNCRACGLPILECRCGGEGERCAPPVAPIMPPIEERIELRLSRDHLEALIRAHLQNTYPGRGIANIEWHNVAPAFSAVVTVTRTP
jgi:hypothetical protein